jgi:cell division protein FtsA
MKQLSGGTAPKMLSLSPKNSVLVAAIDVGTSKIACLIARLKPRPAQQSLPRRTHSIKVLGMGRLDNRGMKAGAVINSGQVEKVVRQALDLAERDKSLQVQSAVISVSGGRIESELLAGSVDVSGIVSDNDIVRVLARASRGSFRDGRATLHTLPIGFSAGSICGLRDPRNIVAHHIGVDLHVVSTDVTVARNLMLALESGHVAAQAMVASPYAAGLSVLTDDDAELGAAVIDMGAGTTTIAAFSNGYFVRADGFALGGRHVTMDLARGLNIHIPDAENIKMQYGIIHSGEMITIPSIGGDRGKAPKILRSAVVRIIKPRLEEILEMVRDRLNASPLAATPRAPVVLTGGACQLPGLPELAHLIVGRPVRVGRPLGISGLPNSAKGPDLAVAAGLLIYPQVAHLEYIPRRQPSHAGGYFSEIGQWLRESFWSA